MMHAKTQMNSEHTKRSEVSLNTLSEVKWRIDATWLILRESCLLCRTSQLQEMYGSEVCDAICALKDRKHYFNTQWLILKKLNIQKNLKLSWKTAMI